MMIPFRIARSVTARLRRLPVLGRLLQDRRATTAVELAMLIWPFLFIMLTILQMGIYYMTQSALDAGVNSTAAMLRSTFTNATSTPTLPTAAQLKADVVSGAGSLIYNNSNLAVEIQQFSNLSSGVLPITDGTLDYGNPSNTQLPGSTLALRAQSSVVIFVPGFSALTKVESTALVRRQAF